MAITKNARTIVAAGTSNAALGTTRGTLDLEASYGGFLTVKITNGGTGPTVGCTCNILVAHASTVPSAGSAGSDWKTIWSFGGGTTAGVITEQSLPIDPSIMALEVEFTGNTDQAVTVEAYLSELTSV